MIHPSIRHAGRPQPSGKCRRVAASPRRRVAARRAQAARMAMAMASSERLHQVERSGCAAPLRRMSSRSASLSRGQQDRRAMPARWAPSTFSFTPPMGSTRPRGAGSPPVMARSPRDRRRDERALSRARAMVTPAEGPSLGMAPAGTWTWIVLAHEPFAGHAELGGAGAGVRERRAAALLHHLAELAGEHEVALAREHAGLDVHDVAAGLRVIHPGRHARLLAAADARREHLRLAEEGRAPRGGGVRRAPARAPRPWRCGARPCGAMEARARSSWRARPASRVYWPR